MCRNIKLLLNFDPPTTRDEMRAAALQYVRKVTGVQKPSQINTAVFEKAIEDITNATEVLLAGMQVKGPLHTRAEEIAKARARNAKRFGTPVAG